MNDLSIANPNIHAVADHPTVVKLRELFFDVLAFELRRFTALSGGAELLCWRTKDGSIEWARLDLFAKPTHDAPNALVLRVLVNKAPVDDVAVLARRRGLLVEGEPWRGPSWSFEAFVTLDELIGTASFLASVVKAHEANDSALVIAPPFETVLASGAPLTWDLVVSETAWEFLERLLSNRSDS